MAIWAAKSQCGDIERLLPVNQLPALFKTKRECHQWIRKEYGYISERKDLQGAPHYWRMPKPVMVLVFEITHLKPLRKEPTHEK